MVTMMEVLSTLATLVILCMGYVIRPTRAVCPAGWHNDGIRRTGAFECVPMPDGPDWPGFGYADPSRQPPERLGGKIYCTGGSSPIVVTDRVVGCQRSR